MKQSIICQLVGTETNNSAYVNELAMLAPTARVLNSQMKVCGEFIWENHTVFNAMKSEIMFVPAIGSDSFVPRNVYM